MGATSRSFGEDSRLQNFRTGESERRPHQVSWARTIVASHKSLQLVPVGVESSTGKPEAEASQN